MRSACWIPLLLVWGALPSAAGELCIVPSSKGTCVTVDCDPLNPLEWPLAREGYSEEGPLPACRVGSCIMTTAGTGSEESGWTISRPPTDSHFNTGVLPAGLSSLYLWLQCNHATVGVAAAEMGLSGSLDVVAFHPIQCTNSGTATDLRLGFEECHLTADLLFGEIVIAVGPDQERLSLRRRKREGRSRGPYHVPGRHSREMRCVSPSADWFVNGTYA
jgi:hypothetical protein